MGWLRTIKRQYFLAVSVAGCVLPFFPVYLKEVKGLSSTEVGYAQAAGSLAMLLAPLLATFLADTWLSTRRLLGLTLIACSGFLFLMQLLQPIWLVVLCMGGMQLMYSPQLALLDGFFFGKTRQLASAGLAQVPQYYQVRVWGSIGFMVPSVGLFFLLDGEGGLEWVVWLGVLGCVLAALNAQAFPPMREALGDPAAEEKLPTLAALSALFRGRARWYCLALASMHFGALAYYGFFPVYLREVVQLPSKWVGLVINFGVLLEIGWVLGLGWLERKFGFKRLMLFGLLAGVVRLFCLAVFPSTLTGVLVHLLHGPEVLAIYVLPVIYVDRFAEPRFRNSIQGVYTVMIVGLPRIVGAMLMGRLADWDLQAMFLVAGSISVVAVASFLFWVRQERRHASQG
ncbi:MAG: MFS transporter [Verrucomicrobiota bacterium]